MASELFKWAITFIVIGAIAAFIFGCFALFAYFVGIASSLI